MIIASPNTSAKAAKKAAAKRGDNLDGKTLKALVRGGGVQSVVAVREANEAVTSPSRQSQRRRRRR